MQCPLDAYNSKFILKIKDLNVEGLNTEQGLKNNICYHRFTLF